MKVFIDLWKRCPLWKSMFSRYQGITVNKDWMRIVYIAKCHQWPIITSFSSIGSATFLSYMVNAIHHTPRTLYPMFSGRIWFYFNSADVNFRATVLYSRYTSSISRPEGSVIYIYNSRIGYTKYSITEKRQNTIVI